MKSAGNHRPPGIECQFVFKADPDGLLLDADFAFDIIRAIVARADELGNFVRIDMEDIACTDATLDFFNRLRKFLGMN